MPKPIRANIDLSQGHCHPPTFSLVGSPDVIINGYPVVRIDDNYSQTHCCGIACHQMGLALGGSTTVFANGKGIHRDGDKISCGDVGDNGSSDVLIDESSAASESSNANAYTDPNDPENTIGYTVKPLVLDYNLNSYDLVVYETCNKIYQDSWLSSVGLVSLVPEYYNPIREEDTGIDIQDQTIPRKLTIDPPLPYPYTIDLNTAVISLIGPVTNHYSNSIHTLTASNYVSEYFNEEIVIQFTLSARPEPNPVYTGGQVRVFNCQ